MKYRPPTIAEVGLKNFMTKNGYNYEEFVKRVELHEPDTIIAKALSFDKNKTLDRRTVANWRHVYKKEQDALPQSPLSDN